MPVLNRVPQKSKPGDAQFLKTIAEETRTSRLVIALLNYPESSIVNANVMYELGIAHALGKPTIIVADSKESILANIAGFTFISYLFEHTSVFKPNDFEGRLLNTIHSTEGNAAHPHYSNSRLVPNEYATDNFYDGLEPAIWWGLNILQCFQGNLSTLGPPSEPLHTLTYIRKDHVHYRKTIDDLRTRLRLDKAFGESTRAKAIEIKTTLTEVTTVPKKYSGKNPLILSEIGHATGRLRNLGSCIEECIQKYQESSDTMEFFMSRPDVSAADFVHGYGELKSVQAKFGQIITEASAYVQHLIRVRAMLKGRYQSELEGFKS